MRSRWMIPWQWINETASYRLLSMWRISFSGILFLWRINLERWLSEQYYIIKYIFFSSQNTPYNLTIFGWFKYIWIFIYLIKVISNCYYLINFFETDFIAHTKPVALCLNFIICTLLSILYHIFQYQSNLII